MDATLMFSASTTPQASAAAPPTATAGAPSGVIPPGTGSETTGLQTPNGRIFAGLMRGLLPTHERQDVAASASASGDLQSEALGADIQVITATSTQPDADSLAAFARAQGLDESAVKALFGEMKSAGILTTAMVDAKTAEGWAQKAQLAADTAISVTTETGANRPDVAWLAHALSADISLIAAPGSATDETAPATTPLTDATTLTTASWLAAQVTPPLASVGTAPPVTNLLTSPSLALTELPATALPALVTTSTTSAPITLQSGSNPALLAGINAPSTSRSTAVQTQAEVEATSAVMPTSAPPEEAMRIRLIPAWANVTQQLAQMSGTAVTNAWGALTAATLGAPIRSVALDLSSAEQLLADATEEANFSSTDSNWTGPGTEPTRTNAAGIPLAATAQPLPGTAQTVRNEHYQQLADRLGQAMAERLQSQIARGEWKLQMRLNPANLGRIDVELDMHAGGLDAMFRSDNAVTRELMAQGMPKLKDTLTQSGMAVASVWVNSDAGRQSDGNPTPQKEWTPPADTALTAKAEAAPAAVTKERRNPDGFDVLA
jgi:flagellar hook-length control protein FliK